MGPVGGRGRRVALLIALAIATLGLSETARAAGWGPELELRNGPITFPTATHVDRDSNATVISTDFLGPFSTFSVSVSRLGDDGALHNVFRTDSAAVDAYSTFGALARSDIDSGGQVNMVWAECDCLHPPRVAAVAIGPDGKLINPEPLEIASYSDDVIIQDLDYSMAPNGIGAVSVVLEDFDSGDVWVEAYRIDKAQTSAELITAPGTGVDATYTDVAINNSGHILVTWGESASPSVSGQVYGPGGPVGSELEVVESGDFDDVTVLKVLMDARGRATVFFTGETTDEFEAFFRQVDATTGSLIGSTPTAIADVGAPGAISERSISLATEDSIRLLYAELEPVEQVVNIRSATIDATGTLHIGSVISEQSTVASMPSLSLRSDGSGGAVYIETEDFNGGPAFPDVDIRFRSLDASGQPLGSAETLGESNAQLLALDGGALSISVADGDAKAIAWPVLDLAGPSMYGIARVYDTTPPVVEIRAPKRVLAGEEILFAATVKDLSQVTATWTFGGGGSATGLFASHVFKEPGRDTVTLEVVDAADNRTRLQRAVEVYPNPDTVGVRPDTRITRPPAIRVFRRQVAIHFRSTQQGSRFECRIGRGPIPGSREARLRRAGKGGRGLVVRGKWRHCSSPLRLRKLPRAVYVVRVRAVNEAGLRDSSPAVVRFRIMRPQKRAGAGRPGPRGARSATG